MRPDYRDDGNSEEVSTCSGHSPGMVLLQFMIPRDCIASHPVCILMRRAAARSE